MTKWRGMAIAAVVMACSGAQADDTVYRNGGPYSLYVPGNAFFDASQYSQDCSNAAYGQGSTLIGFEGLGAGAARAIPACKILAAPVVDLSWVRRNLDAGGYVYNIAFPLKDFGNGRAEIYWMRPCWAGIPSETGPLNCYHGMARLEGVPWVNKFAPATVRIASGEGAGVVATTLAYGSQIGNHVGNWPEPGRSVGFIYTRYGFNVEPPGAYSPYSTAAAALDDWLAESPAPPAEMSLVGRQGGGGLAVETGGDASETGNGIAAGASGPTGSAPFDWGAYCSAPDRRNHPRSQAWIRNCLNSVKH